MIKRLRIKFILINMVIVTVMLGVILGTILRYTSNSLAQETISLMQEIALDPLQQRQATPQAQSTRLSYFVLMVGRGGDMTVVTDGYFDLSDEGLLRELIYLAYSSEEQTGVLRAYQLRFYRVETMVGSQYLIFADISSEISTMNALVRSCIIIGIVSFLLFLIISVLLARWAVRPVEQAWKRQKAFVADASHELKTPLTVILTNAELLQDPEYEEEQGRFAANIVSMSHQMKKLVEELLELARVDDGLARGQWESVELGALLEQAVLPFEPLYFEQGLTLASELTEGLYVQGSPRHLKQVADILLDNAQKYARPHTRICLTCRMAGAGHALLGISNEGEPIEGREKEEIFQRFMRRDEARSRNGSYGLGLAIASEIVKEHRGRIWVESENGVNTFYVSLPLRRGKS